jgi:PEP-CTERM motif-containing protein
MSTVRSFIRRTTAVALVSMSAAAAAQPVVIEVGSYANSGMGAEFATPYDNFMLTGQTSTIAGGTAPTPFTIGTFQFEVGPNCWSCTLTPSFDALLDVTVDGMTQQFDLPYSWYSNGPNDFLSFATPAPVMFDFADFRRVMIAIDSIGVVSSPIGTVGGTVYGTVTVTPVPEPSSYALMLAGLGAIGLIARRRRR